MHIPTEKRKRHRKLTTEEDLNAVKLYQSGLSLSQTGKRLGISTNAALKALKRRGVKRRSHGEGTRLLHARLSVEPPNCIPTHLRDKFHKLLAVFLLTDGYVGKTKVSLICTDSILQGYFSTLFAKVFDLKPTLKAYMSRGKDTSIFSKSAVATLLLISPTYNTYPKNKTKKEYYRGPQPTLAFLENEGKEVIIEALRIAMSCEGSVFPEFARNIVYPTLQFACSNPRLLKQWKNLFEKAGIKSHVLKSRATWSAVKGLGIKELKSIRRFAEIGGFIEGVKITGKSRYYQGLQKNELLGLLIEMKADSFYFPPCISNRRKNGIIKNMIKHPTRKKKYWKQYVVAPKAEKEANKKKIRKMIVRFIASEIQRGNSPTLADIQTRFKVGFSNYFRNKTEAYRMVAHDLQD